MTADTRALLELWGVWKQYGSGLPCYASPTRIMMQALAGSTVREASITDEEAVRVDNAIARLRSRDKEMGDVVVLYYAHALPIRSVAREMKIGKDRADRLLLSGVAWIDGVLLAQA